MSGTCAGDLVYLPTSTSLPITLKPREYNVFTVVPVTKMSSGVTFAPVGLTKMFNSGGAIREVKYEVNGPGVVEMKVHLCGPFGAYSSVRPKRIAVDAKEVEFEYDEASGFVTLNLKSGEEGKYLCDVIIQA